MTIEKTYSKIGLMNEIERVHNDKIVDFALKYPTDYRCRPTLRIYCELKNNPTKLIWLEAECAEDVGRLIGKNVVSDEWPRNGECYLKIIYREG